MDAIARRKFLAWSLGAASVAAAPLSLSPLAHASPTRPAVKSDDHSDIYLASIAKALAFQNMMMDAYATGNTVRLIQIYSDQSGLLSTSFTYDDAASIHAYLRHGTPDSLTRAEILGQGLIYAQANKFPFNDGRFAP